MGTPKLLLDVGGQTVIARLLAALHEGGIQDCWVVVHPDDKEIWAEVRRNGGYALVPETPPPDMRASAQFGLTALNEWLHTGNIERVPPDFPWLLVPADHPVLLPETVQELERASRLNIGSILIPTYHGRPGHPTMFAWKHALEVDQIPADRGLNWLVQRHAADVVHVPVENEGVLLDLDTPDDYERLKSLWQS
jgi:molybdenum cofactor cytidylyltransferase